MEGAKRRAEEPAVATRALAEQADPKERRSEDGARIVALSHCGSHGAARSAAPWRTQDVPRAFSNSSRGRGRKGDLDVPLRIPSPATRLDFIEKDSKRFPDTGGWGYAQFNYDTASDTFTPYGSGANCGYACHTIVAAKDYIFTAYGKR